jgi:hypothetical protein
MAPSQGFSQLEEWLNSALKVSASGTNAERLKARIDTLDRLVELLRYQARHFENNVRLEDVVEGELEAAQSKLDVRFACNPIASNFGTPPVRLQPELLLFLLLHHKEQHDIFDIIDRFIGRLYDSLSVYDFARTQTGVTRCFTNTRFAALTLRKYGLLKFTQTVAYKTWVLSLPGFVVAARVLRRRLAGANKQLADSRRPTLHDEILEAWMNLRDFSNFVEELSFVCEPNVEVFKTFDGFLREAHNQLDAYWRQLGNDSLTRKAREEACEERVKQLEKHPDIGAFYAEFSKCVNVEALLKQLDEA